jgi:hypothetical protein
VLLTFAGLVAAFRVASCCGLPSMLATLGLGNGMAGWLFSVRRVTSSIPACRSRSLPCGWGHPPVAAEYRGCIRAGAICTRPRRHPDQHPHRVCAPVSRLRLYLRSACLRSPPCPARHAARRKPRRCRQTLADVSTNVTACGTLLRPKRGDAACCVSTGQFLARRCRHRGVNSTETSDDKHGSCRIFLSH